MDNYGEILQELEDEYAKCNELFNIAWGLNDEENIRTTFSQKVTIYIPNVQQTIGFLISEFEIQK